MGNGGWDAHNKPRPASFARAFAHLHQGAFLLFFVRMCLGKSFQRLGHAVASNRQKDARKKALLPHPKGCVVGRACARPSASADAGVWPCSCVGVRARAPCDAVPSPKRRHPPVFFSFFFRPCPHSAKTPARRSDTLRPYGLPLGHPPPPNRRAHASA